MDDIRIEWIRNKIFDSFQVIDQSIFDEFLAENEGKNENNLLEFLNLPCNGEGKSVLFFLTKQVYEVEVACEPDDAIEDDEQGTDEKVETDELKDSNEEKAVIKKIKTITERRMKSVIHMTNGALPDIVEDGEIYFFTHSSTDSIPSPSSIEEANNMLPNVLEYGLIGKSPILSLEDSLLHKSKLFACAISYFIDAKRYNEGCLEIGFKKFIDDHFQKCFLFLDSCQKMQESQSTSYVKDELFNQFQKFLAQINRAVKQIEGDIKLQIPVHVYELSEDVDNQAKDQKLVVMLEETIHEWERTIAAAVEQVLKRTPQGPSPLAEVDFWRERNATLSAIHEQLNMPAVKKSMQILDVAQSEALSGFNYYKMELTKYYVEAKDNVRFLSTLERHFKNLTMGSNFQNVIDTIPSLMNALHMVWIISRHYNKDERMVPLMERIGWEVAERVSRVIDIHKVLREPPIAIKKKAQDAKESLLMWKNTYFQVRAKIEASGRDARWEFDRKRLFERTDYMVQICEDIIDVGQVIEEFHNIFGQELKSVTGDPKRIDDVLKRVDALVQPYENVSFDPFNIKHTNQWNAIMEWFRKQVISIDNEAKHFIDDSFKTLRSAEGAFDMLLKFRHIRSRDSINRQMMRKFNDILFQFGKEVDQVYEIFKEMESKPTISKNHPPVAGAILWERSLFYRVKATILKFQIMEDMLNSETGKLVTRKYVAVARIMKAYEDQKYAAWKEKVENTLMPLLKHNLIIIPTLDANSNVKQSTLNMHSETAGYVVDFAPELLEIMLEAKYLEQAGFSIPELARNIALQENKYLRHIDNLKRMLKQYDACLNMLNDAECDLLNKHIHDLRRALKPGEKRLNWNSLGIADYISKCVQAISKFESLINQVQKNAKDIEARLSVLERAVMFKCPPTKPGNVYLEAKEYLDFLSRIRIHEMELLARKYRAIGPLLTKMEGVVAHTNTGCSEKLRNYYAYWESRVYESLLKFVTKNLEIFLSQIQSNRIMFQVETVLSAPEIVLLPPAGELYKLLLQAVRETVEGTKLFIRWMHGSCVETPPQNVESEDDPVIFSFFTDISAHPQVLEMVGHISKAIQSVLGGMNKYLNKWKRYRKLWSLDKLMLVEKFASKKPQCVQFDEKLHFYTNLAEEIAVQPTFKESNFIYLNLEPLVLSIQSNAKGWVKSIGKLMNADVKENLKNLKAQLEGYSEDLQRSPDTLEDLKFVLSSIANISDIQLEVELKIADIQERYRTLEMYDIEVSISERELSYAIATIWEDLMIQSKTVDCGLVSVKATFTELTLVQVDKFSSEAKEFREEFIGKGPGSIDSNLDEGIMLLKQYKEEFLKYERQRQELANAEKLFGLSITMHADMQQTEKELKGLELIYNIYERHKVASEEWASMLWVDLDVSVLLTGINDFIKDLKQIAKDAKSLSVYHILEAKLKEFKNSIPLFSDLKNEALRERHWKSLMELTGMDFDLNPETFTLENMFAMELHRFNDIIQEIVASASKELSIEKGITVLHFRNRNAHSDEVPNMSPKELIMKPLAYVALTGLDIQFNAIHKSIWDTFTANRRQEKVLNINLLPGDAEFPHRKQKQRSSYEFYIPKGILKTNWMKKHLSQVPVLVVVFFDLDWYNQQWKEKQAECASRVAVVRSSLQDRNTKIAVVLIQKSMSLPSGEDPNVALKAESLSQACQLPPKALFVLPFNDQLQGYVTRLESAFYDITQAHYTYEAKLVKQHKEFLNKSQHQLLFVRHQFKIAFYNELKQDAPMALKHYKHAYQYILEHRLTDINNLEVKLVAGFLSYKICRISFKLSAPLDSISQFRKHIDYFKGKIGCSSLAFEHAAWMAKQFSLFGDLFQEASKGGLQAIQTQHPGFYYQQAANHTMIRTEQCRALCVHSEAVNPDPLQDAENLEFYGQRPWRQGCQATEVPDPAMEQAGILSLQAKELTVEHYWIVIPLLSSAVAQFREYKSIRMKLFLMVQMSEEYSNAKDYRKALTLLNRVVPFYRGERWWKLLTHVIKISLRCAYLTASIMDYTTICLELLSNNCDVSPDEKTRIQMNFMRVVKMTPPEPESKCDHESIEKAKELWKAALGANEKHTIDMESLAAFIECRPCFNRDMFQVDEVVLLKVYLRSVGAYPIRFSELGVQFSNPLYNSECIKTDHNENSSDSDLYLEPNKVKMHTFNFILSSSDVNQKLEMKQLYLCLGSHFVLRWKGAGLDANISPSYDSYNYGGECLPIKYTKDGNMQWDSVAISPFANILARDAKVDFTVSHHSPALVDEFYPFEIRMKNLEATTITNTQLIVKLENGKQFEESSRCGIANLYLDESDGGSDEQTGLKQAEFDLSELSPGEVITKVIFLKTPEIGKRIISFKTLYNMTVDVGEEKSTTINCVCSKEERAEVDVYSPFSIAAKVANMQFQYIENVIAGEPFTIIMYIKSSSTWPVSLLDSQFLLKSEFSSVDESLTSQLKDVNLKRGEKAGECQCLVASGARDVLDEPQPIRSVQLGHYVIRWKRSSGSKEVQTRVNLPMCKIQEPLFSISATLPPFGCVQEVMHVEYVIKNRTNFVQEVEVSVQPSDAFMLAGNSQIQLRVLPVDEHKLLFNMYPLFAGEVLLPRLHVNFPQCRQIDTDALAQQYLSQYAFVKPQQITQETTPEIKVM